MVLLFWFNKHMEGKQRCQSKSWVSWNTYTLLLLCVSYCSVGQTQQLNWPWENRGLCSIRIRKWGSNLTWLHRNLVQCREPFVPRLFSVMTSLMGCCKLNVRIWVVSPALSWIQKGKEADIFLLFKKEHTSSFSVFVCSALNVLFSIEQHQSLWTAGRTMNSLCQAPSQMVLTLSWRVWKLSIKQQHLFKTLDEAAWQRLCVSIHPSSLARRGSHPGIRCTETPWKHLIPHRAN